MRTYSKMKAWVLRRGEGAEPRYDAADGFVVVAASPARARQLAADNCGDEGRECWLDQGEGGVRWVS